MKRANYYLLPVLVLFILSFKIQSSGNDLSEAKKAIAEANASQFALFAKNDGSVLALYTDDACLLQPNGKTLCGKQNIAQFFQAAYAAGVRSGKITTLDVYGDGKEYVTEVNTAQVFDANGKLVDDSKSVVIWKKTSKGWKMFRDMFNSNLPLAK